MGLVRVALPVFRTVIVWLNVPGALSVSELTDLSMLKSGLRPRTVTACAETGPILVALKLAVLVIAVPRSKIAWVTFSDAVQVQLAPAQARIAPGRRPAG